MRTAVLILATLMVLMVCIATYLVMQPASAPPVVRRLTTQPTAPPPPTTGPDQPRIHAGEDVWIKTYDPKTGKLASQFRASRYDPQADGTVNVTHPQAEFHYANGQVVRIEGARGRVIMPAEAARSAEERGKAGPPSRGELHDVTVSLFDTEHRDQPALVCNVNNVAFDNDTFRIATESFTGFDGSIVPADQVPVEVRGEEYDFTGRGLTIRWNDRDRRLESLEIAHGQSFTVKSPQVLQKLNAADAPSRRQPRSQRSAPRAERAAAQPGPAAGNAQPATKPAAPGAAADSVVYRAVFEGGVTMTQADQTIAEADVLEIDFPGARPDESNSTPPRQAPRRSSATRPAPTNPAPQPIVIRWPGKLRVTPVQDHIPALAGGDWIARMSSEDSAVTLKWAGSRIRCASFEYHAGPLDLVVNSSAKVPTIVLTDSGGGELQTPALTYRGRDGKATLRGAGQATIPVPDQRANQPQSLQARWSKSCVVTVATPAGDRFLVQSAVLQGNVQVDHPQVRMSAAELELSLGPPDAREQPGQLNVKQIVAKGNVVCDLVDPDQQPQQITADRLLVTTAQAPDGRLVPRTVRADGEVRGRNPQWDLRAGHMNMTLSPTTRPGRSVDVEELFAQQDVKLEGRDGVRLAADQLTMKAVGDETELRLSGQPAASIGNGTTVLSGPIIDAQLNRRAAQVLGPGTLQTTQQTDPSQSPQPVVISWDSGLAADGSANRAEIIGNVLISTRGGDGSHNSAAGSRLLLDLMDAEQHADAPVTRPADQAMNVLAKKAIRTATLDGEVELKSVLADVDGALLRRLHLFAPAVRLESPSRRMVVPSPGRMLYEDLRPSSGAGAPQAAPLGDLRGATAMAWQKEMTIDQTAGQAEMSGDVVIVHGDPAKSAQAFRLDAARVLVEFDPSEQAGSARVRIAAAEGGAQFTSPHVHFEAEQISFDPQRQVLCARGGQRRPAELYDRNGVSTGAFELIEWNTRTQQIERLRGLQGRIRR